MPHGRGYAGTHGIVPPVAQDDPDGIPALLQLRRDIERDVQDALVVIREPRREDMVADLLAVEVQFEKPKPET